MKASLVSLMKCLVPNHAQVRPCKDDNPGPHVLVSAPMGIGSMTMFTPFLQRLRDGWPHADITLACHTDWYSFEVVAGSGLVDHVQRLRCHGATWFTMLRRGIQLGRRGWDIAVVRFGTMFPEIAIALVAGRVPLRAGHVSSDLWRCPWDPLFNLGTPMPDSLHEVDRSLAIADTLGLPRTDEPSLVCSVSQEDWLIADKLLENAGISDADPTIAIHVGSGKWHPWKQWPPVHWRRLIALATSHGIKVIVLGGEDDVGLIGRALECRPSGVVDFSGMCSLRQSACVIARSSVFVSADTGPMHIAAAMRTPVVALFGPTDEMRTGPYRIAHLIVRSDACNRAPCYKDGATTTACNEQLPSCMSALRPERVYEAVQRLLGEKCAGSGHPSADNETTRES